MKVESGTFCCGCLCKNRKMTLLKDYAIRQCFLQIIDEFQMTELLNDSMSICWECEAVINRFIKFKQQVAKCYKTLIDYVTQNQDLSELPQSSKLSVHEVFNIDLMKIEVEIFDNNIKLEKSADDIKQEDNLSTYSENFDDNTLLVEYSNKKKKKKIKEKKKRKKKNNVTEVVTVIELTPQELVEERKILTEREEYVIAMFRCEKCIITFPNIDDLNDHIKLKHEANKGKMQCHICECTFASEVSYAYHMNKHTKRYQCSICMERFHSKRAGTKHYEIMHCDRICDNYHVNGEETYENELTESSPLQNSEVSIKQEASASFPCEFCEKTFRWKTSLRKHLETHRIEAGQKRKPYCEPCRLSFTTTSNLQKHVKTSSKHQIQLKLWKLKESLPETNNAEKESQRAEQIARSVNSARRLFPCPQCGRSFQWRGNLKRHLRSHKARANGELVCEPCNRTFSSIATYKQHMKISKKHVSESDFKYMCSDCGKRFANKTRLKDHVDWEHLKNFVHTCTTCQKVFKSHTSLYLHKQVVHKKDNAEHLCDHCGKHFPNRAKLRSHAIALHSGAAPYACGRCPARFSWRSCLSRHVRRVHNET